MVIKEYDSNSLLETANKFFTATKNHKPKTFDYAYLYEDEYVRYTIDFDITCILITCLKSSGRTTYQKLRILPIESELFKNNPLVLDEFIKSTEQDRRKQINEC